MPLNRDDHAVNLAGLDRYVAHQLQAGMRKMRCIALTKQESRKLATARERLRLADGLVHALQHEILVRIADTLVHQGLSSLDWNSHQFTEDGQFVLFWGDR